MELLPTPFADSRQAAEAFRDGMSNLAGMIGDLKQIFADARAAMADARYVIDHLPKKVIIE